MKMTRLVTMAALALVGGCSTTSSSSSVRGQYLGCWQQEAPGEERLAIQMGRNGRCVITEDDRSWNGTWRREGQKVIVTTGDETVTFWRTGPDTLTVNDGSDGSKSFRRAK